MTEGLSRDTVLAHVARLPTLPAVVSEILGAIEEEAAPAERLVSRINSDPVLVARVLGAANAASVGARARIGTLREAIALIGFNRVRQLVLMTALVHHFDLAGAGFDPTAFWRHSFAVASCSRTLARAVDADAELAFNAGLLHDIGHFFIIVLFPEAYRAILARMAQDNCDLVIAEIAALGVDHGLIGSIMAEHWRLPEVFVEAIAGHHAPESVGFTEFANIVHVAEVLSYALDLGTVANSAVPTLSADAHAHLGLDWPVLAAHFGEIEASYRGACLDFGF